MSSMLDEYMQNAPESMRQYMGGIDGSITPEQWMEMEFTESHHPHRAALPGHADRRARAIAGSEERRMLDLLLSNPVRRRHIVLGAALTMAIALAGVLAVAWILTFIATLASGVDLGAGHLAEGLVVLWPYCLFFGSLALLLSAVVRRGALATIVAAVILVAMYVFDGLAQAIGSLKPLRFASLISQMGTPMQGDFPWTAVLVMLAAVVIFVAGAVDPIRPQGRVHLMVAKACPTPRPFRTVIGTVVFLTAALLPHFSWAGSSSRPSSLHRRGPSPGADRIGEAGSVFFLGPSGAPRRLDGGGTAFVSLAIADRSVRLRVAAVLVGVYYLVHSVWGLRGRMFVLGSSPGLHQPSPIATITATVREEDWAERCRSSNWARRSGLVAAP